MDHLNLADQQCPADRPLRISRSGGRPQLTSHFYGIKGNCIEGRDKKNSSNTCRGIFSDIADQSYIFLIFLALIKRSFTFHLHLDSNKL